MVKTMKVEDITKWGWYVISNRSGDSQLMYIKKIILGRDNYIAEGITDRLLRFKETVKYGRFRAQYDTRRNLIHDIKEWANE